MSTTECIATPGAYVPVSIDGAASYTFGTIGSSSSGKLSDMALKLLDGKSNASARTFGDASSGGWLHK